MTGARGSYPSSHSRFPRARLRRTTAKPQMDLNVCRPPPTNNTTNLSKISDGADLIADCHDRPLPHKALR